MEPFYATVILTKNAVFIPISQESQSNVKGHIWVTSQRTGLEKQMTKSRKSFSTSYFTALGVDPAAHVPLIRQCEFGGLKRGLKRSFPTL